MDNTKWKVFGFAAIVVTIIAGGNVVFNKR